MPLNRTLHPKPFDLARHRRLAHAKSSPIASIGLPLATA